MAYSLTSAIVVEAVNMDLSCFSTVRAVQPAGMADRGEGAAAAGGNSSKFAADEGKKSKAQLRAERRAKQVLRHVLQ